MKGRAIGVLVVAAVMLLAAAFATASTSTTVRPGEYVLRNANATEIPELPSPKNRFTTLDACMKALDAYKDGPYRCDQSNAVTKTSTCADEKAPRLYLAKVMIEGAEYLELPGASFTEDTYTEMADLFVHGPTWPGGYPNCWVRGVAPRAEWRLNTKDEPGRPFMEPRTADMPPGDLIAEEPNSIEPVCWQDECVAPA